MKPKQLKLDLVDELKVVFSNTFNSDNDVILAQTDTLEFLKTIPDKSISLIVTLHGACPVASA